MKESPAYGRCKTVLKMLNDESREGLWEGYLTKRFKELGISGPYYGKTMYLLVQLGAVEQVKRGSGPIPSVWRVYKEPDDLSYGDFEEHYTKVKEYADKPTLTKRVDALEGQVADLARLIRQQAS